MRKTLSAVLAAAALFGGAAISNGAANAYDRWDIRTRELSCASIIFTFKRRD